MVVIYRWYRNTCYNGDKILTRVYFLVINSNRQTQMHHPVHVLTINICCLCSGSMDTPVDNVVMTNIGQTMKSVTVYVASVDIGLACVQER